MFEEREIPMDALLGILAIEKLRYDNGVKIYGEILDIECFWETCYIALEDVASSVSAPIDECNAYIQKFCFQHGGLLPAMQGVWQKKSGFVQKQSVRQRSNRSCELRDEWDQRLLHQLVPVYTEKDHREKMAVPRRIHQCRILPAGTVGTSAV